MAEKRIYGVEISIREGEPFRIEVEATDKFEGMREALRRIHGRELNRKPSKREGVRRKPK